MKFTTFLYWGVFSTHINTQSHLLFSSTQSKTIIRHASVNKIYLKEEKFTRPPAALTGLKKWKTVWKPWFTLYDMLYGQNYSPSLCWMNLMNLKVCPPYLLSSCSQVITIYKIFRKLTLTWRSRSLRFLVDASMVSI